MQSALYTDTHSFHSQDVVNGREEESCLLQQHNIVTMAGNAIDNSAQDAQLNTK